MCPSQHYDPSGVLVALDNSMSVSLSMGMLEGLGYSTEAAKNILEATKCSSIIHFEIAMAAADWARHLCEPVRKEKGARERLCAQLLIVILGLGALEHRNLPLKDIELMIRGWQYELPAHATSSYEILGRFLTCAEAAVKALGVGQPSADGSV